MIHKRILRTGDGSHKISKQSSSSQKVQEGARDVEHFWGWQDELLTEEDKRDVTIINKTE